MAATKKEYLARLQVAVLNLYHCGSVHRQTVPVREEVDGQTIWLGEVEVFDLNGHPRAKRCYAWAHATGKNDAAERVVALLEIPPVISPETAVQAAIAVKVKRKP